MEVEPQHEIDLHLYVAKFYNYCNKADHTYIVVIPPVQTTLKKKHTLRINYDPTEGANPEAVKYWQSQPWCHHSQETYYHLLDNTFIKNPLQRIWMKESLKDDKK